MRGEREGGREEDRERERERDNNTPWVCSQGGFPLPGSYFLRNTVCFICCMYIARQSCEHVRREAGLVRQRKLKQHNTTV